MSVVEVPGGAGGGDNGGGGGVVGSSLKGWSLIGAVLVLGVLVVGLPFLVAFNVPSTGEVTCSSPSKTPPGDFTNDPPAVTLRANQTTQLRFGRRTGAKSLTLIFDVTGKPVPTADVPADFARDDDARFPAKFITSVAELHGGELAVSVCANRSMAHSDPGTYKGDIVLFGGGLAKPVDVPLTITLSDVHVTTVLPLCFIALLVVGSIYSWMLHQRLNADDPLVEVSRLKQYLHWWITAGGVLSVVFGLAAAAGVFNAQYLAADAWGTSIWQYATLFVSMLGAFVAAATVSHIPASGK